MARIEVNHQTLRNVASAITSYCSEQDKQMSIADQTVSAMAASHWTGEDASAFLAKWKTINTSDSTAGQFKEALKNFASVLNACAECYRSAQEKAYNSASSLPRW